MRSRLKYSNLIYCLLLMTQLLGQSFYPVNPENVHQIITPLTDGQYKLDSLAKYSKHLFMQAEIDSSEKYTAIGLKLAKELRAEEQIAYFLLLQSRCLVSRNKYELAFPLLHQAESIALNLNSKYLSSIYYDLTKLFGRIDQMDSLVIYYEKAKVYNEQQNPYNNWKLYHILFHENKELGNETQAWKYLTEAYQLTKTKGDRMDFGFMIQVKKEYAQQTQNWEALAATINDEKLLYADGKKLMNSAHQFLENDEHLSVLERKDKYQRLIKRFEHLEYPMARAQAQLKYAKILITENEFSAAIPFLQSASLVFKEDINSSALLTESYMLLLKALQQEKKFAEALAVSQELLKLKSKEQDVDKNKILLELESKYAAQKISDSLAVMQAENKAKDMHLSKSVQQKHFLLLGILGLSIFSFFLFTLFKKNRQKRLSLQEKNHEIAANLKDREYLIQEVHHRVKNNLQLISSLLSMQSRHIKDTETKEALVDGQNRIHSMALIHQNLYKESDLEGVNLKNYITLICQNLNDSLNLQKDSIQLKLAIAPLVLDEQTAVSIGIIINELVTNSFKYAFPKSKKGEIYISAQKIAANIELIIKDDGIGINSDSFQAGFGTRLIHIFTKKLEAKWEVDNDKGTVNKFTIQQFKVLSNAQNQ